MNKEDAEEYTQQLSRNMDRIRLQIELADRLEVPKALGFKSAHEWVRQSFPGMEEMMRILNIHA